MALADSLIKTVDGLLTRFDATDRKIYKRIITRTGGDSLLGRPGSVTYKDTLLQPQPAVRVVTGRDVALALSSSVLVQVGDYVLTTSVTTLTRDDLQSTNFVFVLKAGTAEEELVIIGYDPIAINGRDVAFDIVARSKKR